MTLFSGVWQYMWQFIALVVTVISLTVYDSCLAHSLSVSSHTVYYYMRTLSASQVACSLRSLPSHHYKTLTRNATYLQFAASCVSQEEVSYPYPKLFVSCKPTFVSLWSQTQPSVLWERTLAKSSKLEVGDRIYNSEQHSRGRSGKHTETSLNGRDSATRDPFLDTEYCFNGDVTWLKTRVTGGQFLILCQSINLTVTSPIVINVPTRGLLAVETNDSSGSVAGKI